MKPTCFDSQEQYDQWIELARPSNLKMTPHAYCIDCTQEYQYEMIRARRCENPGHIFEPQKDAEE